MPSGERQGVRGEQQQQDGQECWGCLGRRQAYLEQTGGQDLDAKWVDAIPRLHPDIHARLQSLWPRIPAGARQPVCHHGFRAKAEWAPCRLVISAFYCVRGWHDSLWDYVAITVLPSPSRHADTF